MQTNFLFKSEIENKIKFNKSWKNKIKKMRIKLKK